MQVEHTKLKQKIMDNDLVIQRVYRNTRRKLKLMAALERETAQDLLKVLIDKEYVKALSKEKNA